MRVSFFFCLMVLGSAVAQQMPSGSEPHGPKPKTVVFKPQDYPRYEFQVTQSVHKFNDVAIRITHAKRLIWNEKSPSYCRAWIEVARGDRVIRRVYYGDFEPVGYSFGVFVPTKQPSASFFTMVKEGDYDGHLLLVDDQGIVTDLMGGSFFVTTDRRFLVSQYSSDESGLAVFNLESRRIIFQSKDIPYIHNWYKDGSGYFFTESEWLPGDSNAHEKRDGIYRLDLKGRSITKVALDLEKLQLAKPVRYDFDPRGFEDCVSR